MTDANRVTIMVDGNVDRKLRNYQANLLKKSLKGVSYSKVLNLIIEKGLKKRKIPELSKYTGESKRVTVMMGVVVDKKIKLRYGKHIIDCANKQCELPSGSYSREVNNLLRIALGI